MTPDHPYWADRTPAARRRSYPTLRGAHTADVAIIGGGLTGATAAYVLANAGLSVVLVERDRLAGGATSRGLGAILPQPDAAFQTVAAAAGVRAARAAWKETRRSAQALASALRRLGIRCDLSPSGLIVNARSADEASDLRREQSARKAARLDAPWLSASAARADLGTESAGAIRLREAFMFDPVKAALGLCRAAEAGGARIFERSEVRRTRFTRKVADVVLASGTIRARRIFVATGEPTAIFGQLRRHVRRVDAPLVVTEPLSAAMRRDAGRRAAVVREAGESPRWLRWLPDDRAMFGGGSFPPVPARQRDRVVLTRTAELMYELSVRYPVISGLPARWGWQVPVCSTTDGLPWIGAHRNYPFHFFAFAFGMHGDGLAWFAAKAALRDLAGETTSDDQSFGFLRHE